MEELKQEKQNKAIKNKNVLDKIRYGFNEANRKIKTFGEEHPKIAKAAPYLIGGTVLLSAGASAMKYSGIQDCINGLDLYNIPGLTLVYAVPKEITKQMEPLKSIVGTAGGLSVGLGGISEYLGICRLFERD